MAEAISAFIRFLRDGVHTVAVSIASVPSVLLEMAAPVKIIPLTTENLATHNGFDKPIENLGNSPVLKSRLFASNNMKAKDDEIRLSKPADKFEDFRFITYQPPESSFRILLVDDSFVFSKFLSRLLEPRGFSVDPAFDGAEAIEFLTCDIFEYHLIITDVYMPRLDGISLISKVRNELKLQIPILVLSSSPVVEHEVMKAGATKFLIKPVPVSQMLESIHSILSLSPEPLN